MGISQEATVLEVLNLFDADDFRPNLERVGALFAEKATYQFSVPARPPVVGRAAIIAELTRQAGTYRDCECEVLTVVSDEHYVVTERIDHVTMLHNDERIHNALLAIFQLNDDGLIVSWREYWDALSLSLSMGVDPVHMHETLRMTSQ